MKITTRQLRHIIREALAHIDEINPDLHGSDHEIVQFARKYKETRHYIRQTSGHLELDEPWTVLKKMVWMGGVGQQLAHDALAAFTSAGGLTSDKFSHVDFCNPDDVERVFREYGLV